jgi:hypothetical protein
VRRSASPAVTESNSHPALVVRAPTRPSFGFGTSKLLVRWKIFAAPMPLVPSGYLTHSIAACFQSRLARWRTRCTPLPTKAGGHVQACQTLDLRASQRLFDDQKRRGGGAPRFPDGYLGVRKFFNRDTATRAQKKGGWGLPNKASEIRETVDQSKDLEEYV